MQRFSDQTSLIIDDIVNQVDFNKLFLFYKDIVKLEQVERITQEELNEILNDFGITKYSLAKRSNFIRNQGDFSKLENIKSEIYKNRNLSKNNTNALKTLIPFSRFCGLRSGSKLSLTQSVVNYLAEYCNEDFVALAEERARCIMHSMSMDDLSNLYEKIKNNDFVDESQDFDELEFLATNISASTIKFFLQYLEILQKCDERKRDHEQNISDKYNACVTYILSKINILELNQIEKIHTELKNKRHYGKDNPFYSTISPLVYEVENLDEETSSCYKELLDANIYQMPNSLIELLEQFYLLTPLKWNTLVLIVMHYGVNPTGKRVNDLFKNLTYNKVNSKKLRV